jgi:hypothetical protein
MLRCLLLLLPLAVATSLKAVPYGETKSAQTLFPPPTSSKINDIQHINIHHKITTGDGAADSLSVLAGSGLAEAVDARDRLNMVDEANVEEEDREFDDMFEEDEDEDEDGDGLEKRQARTTPMYGGVIQIDCLLAPDICKNAGYYQNCIRQAYGNPSLVTYTNGPYDDTVTRINRIRSGVTLQGATPCNGWPWAQRFWHSQNAGLEDPPLQTDEWPMATIWNPPFLFTPPNPQVSLRCTTSAQNSAGSAAWLNFRRCRGPYQPNTATAAYRKWQSKYAYGTRHGPCTKFIDGDTFNVNFNFSSFPPRGFNTTADDVYE